MAITQDKCFPGEVLNVINTRFNSFLEDCRKLLDREVVNNQLIEFGEIHDNAIFTKFNVASLSASFTLVNKVKKTGKDDAVIDPKVTLKLNNKKYPCSKGKRRGGNEGKEEDGGEKKAFGLIKNKDQVPEFKMKDRESWEKFQGKCTDFHAKLKDTIMCPRFHTKGQCHKRCKWAAPHIAAKDSPKDVKKKYCAYLDQI